MRLTQKKHRFVFVGNTDRPIQAFEEQVGKVDMDHEDRPPQYNGDSREHLSGKQKCIRLLKNNVLLILLLLALAAGVGMGAAMRQRDPPFTDRQIMVGQ